MARKVPHNYILLSLFTIIEGFMLGMVTLHYSISEVMLAVGVCAAVTLALTIFAFQTKIDFTVIGGNVSISNVLECSCKLFAQVDSWLYWSASSSSV